MPDCLNSGKLKIIADVGVKMKHSTGYFDIVAIKKIGKVKYCQLESYNLKGEKLNVNPSLLLWPIENVQDILDNNCLTWRRTL